MAISFAVLSFSSANACYTGCVKDKCSGEPLANYPITYCHPHIVGGPVGGCTTFYTNSQGCFSYNGEVGSSINIGGTSSTYSGGPCNNLGNVSAYALTGKLGSSSSSGFHAFHQGSPNNVGVNNSQIYSCADQINENYISWNYVAPNIDLRNYCIKIEIFRIVGFSQVLVKTVDWTPYFDSRGINYGANTNINELLKNFPKSTYRMKVSIKCCGSSDPSPQNGANIFSGNFVWTPAIQAGDAEFNWIGSAITEAVNNDGANNNLHPNNGTIWQLGAASAGVAWVNSLTGSAAVTKIQYTLIQDEFCLGTNLTTIKNETTYPSSGQQVNNINFNSWTSNYFAFGGPSINIGNGNIPNPFPIKYTYNACFLFTVKVWGNQNCPPKEFSGTFKIYSGNAAARVANGSTNNEMNMTYLSGDDGILEIRSISDLTKNIYPNPTSGVIYLENFKNDPSTARLFDSQGRIQAVQMDNNQMDMSHLPSGLYFLHTPDDNLGKRIDKVIKI